jgi:hypothetical protein
LFSHIKENKNAAKSENSLKKEGVKTKIAVFARFVVKKPYLLRGYCDKIPKMYEVNLSPILRDIGGIVLRFFAECVTDKILSLFNLIL